MTPKNFIDLTGKRFGRLAVIERAVGDMQRGAAWSCRCDCGAIAVVYGFSLRNGNTASCGCLKEDINRAVAIGDGMVGRRFGGLVVLYRSDVQKSGAYWTCRCDCGNLHVARATALRHGHTTSCGCKRLKDAPRSKAVPVTIGEVFGLLTVVEQLQGNVQGSRWKCACQCGGSVEARGKDLRSGNTRSCGCAKRAIGALAGIVRRNIAEEMRP